MNGISIPPVDRSMSRTARFAARVFVYGIAIPLTWLVYRLGLAAGFVGMLQKIGPKNRWQRVFADYEPNEHDVFVSTFAKSGTNWMMQIAHQIAFRGDGDYANIHDVVSWPDMDAMRRRKMSVALDDTLVRRASPTGLRVIKTHLSADHVPYSEKARYLVVVRDPKEVFVSSFHFARGAAGPMMPSPEVWFELFVSGRFPLDFGSSWAAHTAGYWALRDRPNVLLLSFGEMKQDLGRAVRQVADVLGVELTETEFGHVVAKSSFGYMKSINDRFSPTEPGSMPWAEGFTMMRQGRSGQSDELLSPEQQARIDARFQAELERLGSDFPYGEFFNVVTAHGRTAVAAQA